MDNKSMLWFIWIIIGGLGISSIVLNKEDLSSFVNKVRYQTESTSVEHQNDPQPELTTEEIEKWIDLVLSEMYEDVLDTEQYDIHIYVDEKTLETMVIIFKENEGEEEILTMFTINEFGELEESGDYTGYKNGEWELVSSSFMDVSDVSKKGNLRSSKVNLTAKEFANIYAAFTKSQISVMSVQDFNTTYGDSHEGDESIQVVTYDESSQTKEENMVTCVVATKTKPTKFVYGFDNNSQKAYRMRNGSPENKEEYIELTDFIKNKKP